LFFVDVFLVTFMLPSFARGDEDPFGC
jgi:hypothetical protein